MHYLVSYTSPLLSLGPLGQLLRRKRNGRGQGFRRIERGSAPSHPTYFLTVSLPPLPCFNRRTLPRSKGPMCFSVFHSRIGIFPFSLCFALWMSPKSAENQIINSIPLTVLLFSRNHSFALLFKNWPQEERKWPHLHFTCSPRQREAGLKHKAWRICLFRFFFI